MQLQDMLGVNIPITKNQVNFIRLVRAQGFGPTTYSGRGMMGATCPAVFIDRVGEIKLECFYCSDAMGKGSVLYARY